MTGLTVEQRTLLEQRFCERGHRFDGANYPTPEGVCPLCAWPEVAEEINRFERLLVDDTSQPREPLHPSVAQLEQSASPSLTALSQTER
jgi:hypothetical protein